MTPVTVAAAADGALEVVLRGEIDYTNAAHINEVVRTAVAGSAPPTVRVDLAAVTFLDSSGIGVLVHALKVADASGAGFRVRGPGPKVLDQLRITGLDELFPVDA